MSDSLHRLARLEGYLQQDPANVSLLTELADGLIQLGQFDRARPFADQALALRPQDAQARYRMAVIDRYSGRVQAAADALAALVNEGHDAPAMRLELARAQAILGSFQACLETLAPLDPQALPGQMAEAAVLIQVRARHHLNELDAAIKLAETFLQLKPDSATVAAALGTLYLDAQRTEDAARLFQAWEHQTVQDGEMLAVGGFLALEQADVQVALARFEQSLSAAPQAGRAALGTGLAHAAAGDLSQAKAALARATQLMPTHLGSWHALAWMHLLDSELDAAEAAFNQALVVDRTFADNFGGLAMIAAIRGNRAQADELIRTGYRLDKASLNVGMAVMLLRHGGAMAGLEFLDSALAMFKSQALAGNPGMRVAFERLLASRAGGPR